MARYPEPIEQLLQSFTALPGVGRKTAERFVFFALKQPSSFLQQFSQHLQQAQTSIMLCEECSNFSTTPKCDICSNSQRNHQTICVVAESSTVFTLEQSGAWAGVYHVLGGTINQIEGIGPDQLRIRQLIERVQRNHVQEIVIATNPDHSGEATALYVIEALKGLPIKITRLARGLPAGADVEYADDVTLGNALRDRKVV
jgi:recombination protein RecR